MPSWKDYKGQAVGLARIMGESPFSDGQTAGLIKNWVVDEQGYLDSTYRIMPFIPYVWNGGLPPKAFEEIDLGDTKRSGVLAMKYVEFNGERPEILFLTNEGVFRYAPWSRPSLGSLPRWKCMATGCTSHFVTVAVSGYGMVGESDRSDILRDHLLL